MIVFPHAKINLGLSVISKRADGFHNLETVFYPLPLRDALEIVQGGGETRLFQTGTPVIGNQEENLVLKAYFLLKKDYPQIGSLEIHLHKAIPMGAGLGGGSSDAAFALQLITRFYGLRVSAADLLGYALHLGSDCPFFMQSSAAYAVGRGELMEPVGLDLSAYSFLLIHPEIRIETAWAYSKIKPNGIVNDLKKIIMEPIECWKTTLRNDFEQPVFEEYPRLPEIKKRLYEAGALYASMSGSGSTIFGIFNKSTHPQILVDNASQTYIN